MKERFYYPETPIPAASKFHLPFTFHQTNLEKPREGSGTCPTALRIRDARDNPALQVCGTLAYASSRGKHCFDIPGGSGFMGGTHNLVGFDTMILGVQDHA